MHGDYALIVTLAVGFSLALLLGYATQRLGLSPIVGYLLAGVVASPNTPGISFDASLAHQLAEVGVILLMFGVGLHFHVKDLLAVRGVAIPGAIGQSLIATGLGAAVALGAGWSVGAGLVLGIAVSVASTVVLMRVLLDNKALDTPAGHIAVGWLIVEDIFTVVVLVVLPAVAGSFGAAASGGASGGGGVGAVLGSLGLALFKVAILGALLLGVGNRLIPRMLLLVARSRSHELFTLAVLAVALAIAVGSAVLFGASMALGAFLAGLVVGQSEVSHQAAADALPMRDAFAVLFFVSVGMLFDHRLLLDEPLLVVLVLAIVLVAKPLAALGLVSLLGRSTRTGLTVAIGLAQIGEFSFILADVALQLGVLPEAGRSVLVAGALLSIGLNPLLFRLVPRLERWIRARPRLSRALNRRADARGVEASEAAARDIAASTSKAPRAIVVGFGPTGETAVGRLRDFGIDTVVIELNVDTVARLAGRNQPAIYGDASQTEILRAAGVEDARYLLVTLPDVGARLPVVAAARAANPSIRILVRARYLAERAELEHVGVAAACYEEAEVAVRLAEQILDEVGADTTRVAEEVRRIRARLLPRQGLPTGEGA